MAAGLGQQVERTRGVLLLVAVALTAGAVTVVGAVGFIGLIGPHIARRMVGNDERVHLLLSGLVTSALLMCADVVAQVISYAWPFTSARIGLPVGAVTAGLGVPFFLYLLRQSNK